MDNELIEQLRIQADEIASSGHAGCGNTMRDAADRLERIAAAPDAPSAEPVYAYRRKGFDDFCTCNEARYIELSQKPTLFETAFFYALPPDADAEIARLRAEVKRLQTSWNAQCESADKLFELNEKQAERIAELESSLEIEKGQCELREEENSILFTRIEAQAAALEKAREVIELALYVADLCGGTWESMAKEALNAIAQLDGAQAGEEVMAQNDAERMQK